jgi:RND family efflux transporter MFP subunit
MSRRSWIWSIALLSLLGCAGGEEEEAPAPPQPVTTARVEPAPFRPTLRLLGVVRAAGEAPVAAPVRGRLRYPPRFARGLVDGAAVAAGEPLVVLVNEEVEHAQAMARIRSAAADAERDRWERAFAAGVESEAQAVRYREAAASARQELATAQRQTARLVVRAPLGGRLSVAQPLPAGSEVEAGAPLFRVVAAGGARVEGWAAAGDRALLAPGQPVRVLSAAGGRPLAEGVLRELAPELDAAGALRAIAEIESGAELPPAGEGVELEVSLGEHPAALSVPASALVLGEGASAVFVAVRQRGLVARRREVQTGLSSGGRVEILDGLHPGDRVVVEGAAFLADGAAIAEASAGPGGAGDGSGSGGGGR